MRAYLLSFTTIALCVISLGLKAQACDGLAEQGSLPDGTVVITNRV